jgi:hypothetical protein
LFTRISIVVLVYGTPYHLVHLGWVGYIGGNDQHLSAKGLSLLGRLLQFTESPSG